MDVGSLAASAVATSAKQTRDGFAVAAIQISNDQEQAMAGLIAQVADTAKAQTDAGVGTVVDVSA